MFIVCLYAGERANGQASGSRLQVTVVSLNAVTFFIVASAHLTIGA